MSSASFVHGGYPPLGPEPLPDTPGNEDLEVEFAPYTSEAQLPEMVSLIEKELSEPYLIYNYRYFLLAWPKLCELVYACRRDANGRTQRVGGAIGVVVSKLERHLKGARKMRGYIAMLSVHTAWRGRGLARKLVERNLEAMIAMGAEEVVLETEVDNIAALTLYESLYFLRDKRLHRFYLNGKDAYRLIYPVPLPDQQRAAAALQVSGAQYTQAPVSSARAQLQAMLDAGAIA